MTAERTVLHMMGFVLTMLAVALLARLSGASSDLAPAIGLCAGFVYFAFAFQPWRRALFMAATFIIVHTGIMYFRFVRQDAFGVGVSVVAMAIGLGVVLTGKRRFHA